MDLKTEIKQYFEDMLYCNIDLEGAKDNLLEIIDEIVTEMESD